MAHVRFHSEARHEAGAAAEWYENQRPGLGEDFLVEPERVIDVISDSPRMWPVWPGAKTETEIRRALLSRFPYAVAYVCVGEDIIVSAVAHLARRPGYWKERLK